MSDPTNTMQEEKCPRCSQGMSWGPNTGFHCLACGYPSAPDPEGLDLEADIAKMDALIAEICHNGGQHSAEFDEWCEVNKALWKSLRRRLRARAEGGGDHG